MILADVNVLVYAHRPESPEHAAYAHWLQKLVEGHESFAMSEPVMSGFVRIVTRRGIFVTPTPTEVALAFVDRLLQQPHCVRLRPGPRHWQLFQHLCLTTHATGKLIADAYHAALALEHGCELATNDIDMSRFPGLRWAHPLRQRHAG